MSKRTIILLVIVAPVLVISLLYLRVLVHRLFFEKPLSVGPAVRTQLRQAAFKAEIGATRTATLYFPSYNDATLVPEQRQIVAAKTPVGQIRQILAALIEGSHAGSNPSLPPATTVRAVFLTEDGTAFVDFSKDVTTNFQAGIESETLAVYSIVSSLTANVPSVRKVRILIQGQEADTLDGHVDLTSDFVPDPDWTRPSP